jgi:hypothetical protein
MTDKAHVERVNRLVLESLSRLDPYGLKPGRSAPADEYQVEADRMARLLIHHGRISVRQADQIWLDLFGAWLTDEIGKRQTEIFVAELNTLVA